MGTSFYLDITNVPTVNFINFCKNGMSSWSVVQDCLQDLPGGSDGKESACSIGDPGLIPGLGRSPGQGNGNLLQHCCLENAMDRGAWQARVHGVTKSWT